VHILHSVDNSSWLVGSSIFGVHAHDVGNGAVEYRRTTAQQWLWRSSLEQSPALLGITQGLRNAAFRHVDRLTVPQCNAMQDWTELKRNKKKLVLSPRTRVSYIRRLRLSCPASVRQTPHDKTPSTRLNFGWKLPVTVLSVYFYQRGKIVSYTNTLILLEHRCPSVCLPVTLWYCIKPNKPSVLFSSPSESPKTLLFGMSGSSRNSKEVTPRGAIYETEVGTNWRFSTFKPPYLRNSAR